jgi:hypothetical protein
MCQGSIFLFFGQTDKCFDHLQKLFLRKPTGASFKLALPAHFNSSQGPLRTKRFTTTNLAIFEKILGVKLSTHENAEEGAMN